MQYQINGQYHNVDIELEKVKLSAIISCYDHFKSTNNYDQAIAFLAIMILRTRLTLHQKLLATS